MTLPCFEFDQRCKSIFPNIFVPIPKEANGIQSVSRLAVKVSLLWRWFLTQRESL